MPSGSSRVSPILAPEAYRERVARDATLGLAQLTSFFQLLIDRQNLRKTTQQLLQTGPSRSLHPPEGQGPIESCYLSKAIFRRICNPEVLILIQS